jgi:hypothetical protein
MKRNRAIAAIVFGIVAIAGGSVPVTAQATAATPNPAVGPQYDTTYVYVAPDEFDHLVRSVLATFGGTASKQVVMTMTPTPSSTVSQLILTPVGTISVFGFKTSIPFPFGLERTGYLVSAMDAALRAARATGTDVADTIRKAKNAGVTFLLAAYQSDHRQAAMVQFPGGYIAEIHSAMKN